VIVTKIIGGLGNQMFQYAAGIALALEKNTTLALDVSGFENYELHQGFELQRVFNSIFEIASKADIQRLLGWQSSPRVQRIVSRKPFSLLRNKNFIVEPHFQYWPSINYLTGDCYLSGYWQSEKYFSDVADQIRESFTFKIPLENQNAELAKQISQVNSVSLHVRRGDYANNPKTISTHGLCSLEYYESAISYLTERVQQPDFFIFSDDIEWVKNNLKIDYPHQYVEHNLGSESYNDMRLMSMCQHHIIANSSFSWWGAWLNPNMDKIVVAPKCWFANQTDLQDLLPTGWKKL